MGNIEDRKPGIRGVDGKEPVAVRRKPNGTGLLAFEIDIVIIDGQYGHAAGHRAIRIRYDHRVIARLTRSHVGQTETR